MSLIDCLNGRKSLSDVSASTARHIAVCLVVRGLLDRLIERDVIGPADMLAIRDFAVDFDADIGVTIPANQPVLHHEIKEEVLAIWESLGVPRALPQSNRLPTQVSGVTTRSAI